jgi:hypothetical protein
MKTLAKEFGFGTWSVRTMLRPGSIKEYDICIMAVQETTWQGEAIIDLKSHTLLQTGQNTGIRGFGVSFAVDSRCKENVLGYQPINERVGTLRMKRKFGNITFKYTCTRGR